MGLKNEKGQAMVEFALVLPVLLLIIAGIIDFGLIFNQKVLANNASREAARYVAVHYSEELKSPTAANTKALEKVNVYLPSYILSKTPTVETVIDEDEGEVKVTVKWATNALMPIYSKLFDEVKIESTAFFKVEQ
jgi:Flp pilus assembly protein TadG